MPITRNEVVHVANLAKLELSTVELDKFSSQLESILGYIDQLDECDVSDIELTALTANTNLRDDVVVKKYTPDDVLKNAPVRSENFYRVDKVIG